ncbi:hypothetical protein Btru_073081 [Bulinus truncatus]|nr:hypothetical protein Btru_073081 [Bulinus truncatus]
MLMKLFLQATTHPTHAALGSTSIEVGCGGRKNIPAPAYQREQFLRLETKYLNQQLSVSVETKYLNQQLSVSVETKYLNQQLSVSVETKYLNQQLSVSVETKYLNQQLSVSISDKSYSAYYSKIAIKKNVIARFLDESSPVHNTQSHAVILCVVNSTSSSVLQTVSSVLQTVSSVLQTVGSKHCGNKIVHGSSPDHSTTTGENKDSDEDTNSEDDDECRHGQELHKQTSKGATTPDTRKRNEDHNRAEQTHENDAQGSDVRVTTSDDGTTKGEMKREDEKTKGGVISNGEESTKADDQAVLHFNLLNPELLSKQLEVAELDDDQTEELLHNAKKINSQLRKILRQQQLNDAEKSPPSGKSTAHHSPSRKRAEGKTSAPLPGGRSASSKRATGGHGTAPSAGRRKGCDREMTSLPQIHNTQTGSDRAKSGKSRKGSAKSRASSSRTGIRPEWDDRFIYS